MAAQNEDKTGAIPSQINYSEMSLFIIYLTFKDGKPKALKKKFGKTDDVTVVVRLRQLVTRNKGIRGKSQSYTLRLHLQDANDPILIFFFPLK